MTENEHLIDLAKGEIKVDKKGIRIKGVDWIHLLRIKRSGGLLSNQ
jgi:hypothetical protein